MRARLFVLRGVDVQIGWHRQEDVQLKWRSAKWLCGSLFWGELVNKGFMWLHHTSLIARIVFFFYFHCGLCLSKSLCEEEMIISEWEKKTHLDSNLPIFCLLLIHHPLCKINHFNCTWNKKDVYQNQTINMSRTLCASCCSRASAEWVDKGLFFFFLQDGSLHLSELCKPAVLVLVGSALGSSVLGICLIHLSKSLRWISIRCQVPVIITTVEEREADETGFPLHHRIEKIFPLKCRSTILTKQQNKTKQNPASLSSIC